MIAGQALSVQRQYRQAVQIRALAEDAPRLTPGAIEQDEHRNARLATGGMRCHIGADAGDGIHVDHAVGVIGLVIREDDEGLIALIFQQRQQARVRLDAIPAEDLGARQHIRDQAPGIGRLVMLQRMGDQPELDPRLGGDLIGTQAIEPGQAARLTANHLTAARLELTARMPSVPRLRLATGQRGDATAFAWRDGIDCHSVAIDAGGDSGSRLRRTGGDIVAISRRGAGITHDEQSEPKKKGRAF